MTSSQLGVEIGGAVGHKGSLVTLEKASIKPRNCAPGFWNSLSGPIARHGEYQNISMISNIDIGLVPYLLLVLKVLSWVLIVAT